MKDSCGGGRGCGDVLGSAWLISENSQEKTSEECWLVENKCAPPTHRVLPSPSNHCFLYLSLLFNIITIIIVYINNVLWLLLSLFKRQCLQLSQCVIVLFSQRTAVFRVTLEIAILKSYQCFTCKKTKVPARSMFHEMHHSLNENLGYY